MEAFKFFCGNVMCADLCETELLCALVVSLIVEPDFLLATEACLLAAFCVEDAVLFTTP